MCVYLELNSHGTCQDRNFHLHTCFVFVQQEFQEILDLYMQEKSSLYRHTNVCSPSLTCDLLTLYEPHSLEWLPFFPNGNKKGHFRSVQLTQMPQFSQQLHKHGLDIHRKSTVWGNRFRINSLKVKSFFMILQKLPFLPSKNVSQEVSIAKGICFGFRPNPNTAYRKLFELEKVLYLLSSHS